MQKSFEVTEYDKTFEPLLIEFLEKCLPESQRALDINGRHSYYLDIQDHFRKFWCMFDGGKIIGVVAVSELNEADCELKSLYLLERYHGRGYGKNCSEKRWILRKNAVIIRCILIRCQQAEKRSHCTEKQALLILKNTIQVNVQMFLWYLT